MRNEGVSGFFEDIPTLIVVIIGFGIFLLSLVNAFVGYQAQQDTFKMHQENLGFMEAIRAYDKFTYNSMEGVFHGDKIIQIPEDTIRTDFNPDALGYDYRIIINDVSDYPDSNLHKVSFQTATPPPEGSKYTSVSSVIIKIHEHYHAAQLIVTIWK
jgi:hypothetical protein